LDPDDVEERVREAGRRHETGLDAALGTDVVDRRAVVTVGHERLGHREGGEHVAGGAATGHNGEGPPWR
jgi:hypothetical protein